MVLLADMQHLAHDCYRPPFQMSSDELVLPTGLYVLRRLAKNRTACRISASCCACFSYFTSASGSASQQPLPLLPPVECIFLDAQLSNCHGVSDLFHQLQRFSPIIFCVSASHCELF